jgi:hypothetical protein
MGPQKINHPHAMTKRRLWIALNFQIPRDRRNAINGWTQFPNMLGLFPLHGKVRRALFDYWKLYAAGEFDKKTAA